MSEENTKNYTAAENVEPNRIVKLSDGNILHCSSATDKSIGVTTEVGAEAGQRIDVVHYGFAEVESGGAISENDRLTSDSQGRAIPAATASAVTIGKALVDVAVSGLTFSIVML